MSHKVYGEFIGFLFMILRAGSEIGPSSANEGLARPGHRRYHRL